jgi:hypothetical protein
VIQNLKENGEKNIQKHQRLIEITPAELPQEINSKFIQT